MRFIPKAIATLISLSIFNLAFAAINTTPEVNSAYKQEITYNRWWSPSRVYIGADGGYGVVNGAYHNDGDVTFARLTLGLHAYECRQFSFGAELGAQSGNPMRLQADPAVIAASGGLQPQATLKPFVDFLVTLKSQFTNTLPLFGILKGGIAYRQLQLDYSTSSSDNVRRVNAELQAGLGYNLTDHVMLTIFYQGIYSGSDAGVGTDTSGNNLYIDRIPTQQAGFLGIEYSF